MPWNASDAERFKKSLSRKQRRKWASIANGALSACMEGGDSEKDCSGRAVRIANSRFSDAFNPAMSVGQAALVMAEKYDDAMACDECPEEKKASMRSMLKSCMDDGGNEAECKAEVMEKMASSKMSVKTGDDFEMGDDMAPEMKEKMKKCMESGMSKAECMEKMKKEMSGLGECEMEVFRPGTHNGDDFDEGSLEEIASNFHKLKSELRPKLKITHRDNQETIAGLASYGDIVDVFLRKAADGTKRLFAKIANVPKEVLGFIKDRRFPERSIELYPNFKLGTEKDSPIYKNVLKAIALLGHEMPAVTGMAPVVLAECLECQRVVRYSEDLKEMTAGDTERLRALSLSVSAVGQRLKMAREGVEQ